jgi:hypothetical protein
LIKGAHIEVEAVFLRDLAALALTRAADRNSALGIPDCGGNFLDGMRRNQSIDDHRIQLRDVVDHFAGPRDQGARQEQEDGKGAFHRKGMARPSIADPHLAAR